MAPKLKGLYLLLVLSLIGNIFVAGVWIGKEMRPDKKLALRGEEAGPPEMMNMRQLAAYLPQDQRLELRRLIEGHRDGLRDTFRTMRQAEKRVQAILEADTVDKTALAAALDEIDAGARNLHGPLRSILLDIVADLDLETRQKLAKDMYQRRQNNMDRRREGGFRPDFGRRPPPPRRDGERGEPGGWHPDGPPPPRPEDDWPEDDRPEGDHPDDGPPPDEPQ